MTYPGQKPPEPTTAESVDDAAPSLREAWESHLVDTEKRVRIVCDLAMAMGMRPWPGRE